MNISFFSLSNQPLLPGCMLPMTQNDIIDEILQADTDVITASGCWR
jgi:hypothetical protein